MGAAHQKVACKRAWLGIIHFGHFRNGHFWKIGHLGAFWIWLKSNIGTNWVIYRLGVYKLLFWFVVSLYLIGITYPHAMWTTWAAKAGTWNSDFDENGTPYWPSCPALIQGYEIQHSSVLNEKLPEAQIIPIAEQCSVRDSIQNGFSPSTFGFSFCSLWALISTKCP